MDLNFLFKDSLEKYYETIVNFEGEYDNDKLLYFSRIADSFVALFLTIDTTMRDKFFNVRIKLYSLS